MLAAVKQNGEALEDASYELQNDREIVMAAVTQHGDAVRWASDELQNDPEVVLAAATQDGSVLQWASDELQDDRAIVLAAVTQNGGALQFASDELKNDREIVLAAVTQNGIALKHASDELIQNDRNIVLAAVTQNGIALRYASDELIQNDREIVLAAVTQNGIQLRYTSDELQNDLWIRIAAATAHVQQRTDLVEEVLLPLFKLIAVELEPILQDRTEVDCVKIKLIENAVIGLGRTVMQNQDWYILDDDQKHWNLVLEKVHALDKLIGDVTRNPCIWTETLEEFPGFVYKPEPPGPSSKRDRSADEGDYTPKSSKLRIATALANARLKLGLHETLTPTYRQRA